MKLLENYTSQRTVGFAPSYTQPNPKSKAQNWSLVGTAAPAPHSQSLDNGI